MSEELAELEQRRAALVARVQEMLQTPEDQRPKAQKALRAWLADLEGTQRVLEQLDKLVTMLREKPKRITRAAATQSASSADESDVVILARIPKGQRAEMRVTSKTWKGRHVIDVRCWAMAKGSADFSPTRKGVAVDARMLPALVEALQLAQKNA